MPERKTSTYKHPPIKEAVFDLQTRNEQILTQELFNKFLEQLDDYSSIGPLLELKNKIYNIYEKHQTNDWDGYEAEPIQYLKQSLRFAEALFAKSRLLIESVDIVPENDGCLCFEWFKTDSEFINVSVKNDILIFSYKIGDKNGCGEITFSDFSREPMLIELIKKIA